MKVNKRSKAKKALKKKIKSIPNDFIEESLEEKPDPVRTETYTGNRNSCSDSDSCMKPKIDAAAAELECPEEEEKQNNSEELEQSDEENQGIEINNEKKKRKKGIIYVSNIPKHMNVTRIREYLGQYGDIHRVYLQPEKFGLEKQKNKKKRLARHFTEGWVEFASKRAAKKVPELLNNTNIGTRKKSQFYDCLWSIKYLPRFKWVHLTEKINYEQAVYKQRLRAEVSQARKEATFFQSNLDKSEFIKKQNKKAKLKTELKT